MFKKLVNTVLATLSLTLLLVFPWDSTLAAVRFNPQKGLWEGNICASPYAWTYVPFQPVGTLCVIRLPNGYMVQGMIINQ